MNNLLAKLDFTYSSCLHCCKPQLVKQSFPLCIECRDDLVNSCNERMMQSSADLWSALTPLVRDAKNP